MTQITLANRIAQLEDLWYDAVVDGDDEAADTYQCELDTLRHDFRQACKRAGSHH